MPTSIASTLNVKSYSLSSNNTINILKYFMIKHKYLINNRTTVNANFKSRNHAAHTRI